jgi:hypothetical protein
MKKKVIKTAFAGLLVILALALVTCQPEVPEGGGSDGGSDYTDVVYGYVGAGSDIRVKSVTLYLDGTVVPRTAAQRKLDLEAARMSHDFFEVVFWNCTVSTGGTPVTTNRVARASWDLGQQAGISGLYRNSPAGINYSNVTQVAQTGNAATGSSVIFVGKKSSKTLLGVGWLSHIGDTPIESGLPLLVDTTRSVTFTVAPLQTWLGFQAPSAGGGGPVYSDALILRTMNGVNDATPTNNTVATFQTGAGMSFTDATATRVRTYTGPGTTPGGTGGTRGDTLGDNRELKANAVYPLFMLPSVKNLTTDNIDSVLIPARYTVGGLDAAAAVSPSVVVKPALYTAIRTWGTLVGGTGAGLDDTSVTAPTVNSKGGLQFIKRVAAFMYQGATYGVEDWVVDKATQVALNTATLNDVAFTPTMDLTITQTPQSGGVFAITFQQPVYALTALAPTNINHPPVTKWFIRPDYERYQYLLDNGRDSGGAVLFGTDLEGGVEWLEIKTTGIGFDNE